jgi:hypothetical protein
VSGRDELIQATEGKIAQAKHESEMLNGFKSRQVSPTIDRAVQELRKEYGALLDGLFAELGRYYYDRHRVERDRT